MSKMFQIKDVYHSEVYISFIIYVGSTTCFEKELSSG